MPAICIHIRGAHPLPYANNEWDWRQQIAHAATEAMQHYPQPDVTNRTVFAVHIKFFFVNSTVLGGDLDNLAKPVLDTLFLANHPQVPPHLMDVVVGVVFQVDDGNVRELILRKVPVKKREEEGTDIFVTWN